MTDALVNFKQKLREYRLKVTPQRLAIFMALSKYKHHPDAETIFTEVRKEYPEMSRATVYSTLRSLKKSGLIQEIATCGDVRRFDDNPSPHPHVVCLGCHTIKDVVLPEDRDISTLEEYVAEKTQYKVITERVSFYGYCPDCRRKMANDRRGIQTTR